MYVFISRVLKFSPPLVVGNKPEVDVNVSTGVGTYWKAYSTMAPIYTPVIMADNGIISFMQGNQLLILGGDDGTTIYAALQGGEWPLWIGGTSASEAPTAFKADGSGKLAAGNLTWDAAGNVALSGFTRRIKRVITNDNAADYLQDDETGTTSYPVPNIIKMGNYVSFEGSTLSSSYSTIYFPKLVATSTSLTEAMLEEARTLVGNSILIYNNLTSTNLTFQNLIFPNGGTKALTLYTGYMLMAECRLTREAGVETIGWHVTTVAQASSAGTALTLTPTATCSYPTTISPASRSGTTLVEVSVKLTDQYGFAYQPTAAPTVLILNPTTSHTTAAVRTRTKTGEGEYLITIAITYKSSSTVTTTMRDSVSATLTVDGKNLSDGFGFTVDWTNAATS